MKILVTGAAGFIGYHLCQALIHDDHEVIGIDNLNDYYDVNLKISRLKELGITDPEIDGCKSGNFTFFRIDLLNTIRLEEIISAFRPAIIVHLAAQAGVRYSFSNPQKFIDANVQGFFNLLECCRKFPPSHFLYASSSSVYGSNTSIPFNESDSVNNPLSLYGATKIAGEAMANAYSKLYHFPVTGLRFFTVYGPWGRPDMAYFTFTKDILSGTPIKVFNGGDMSRDFTYVDDIINGIVSLVRLDQQNLQSSPQRLLNIGRSKPVNLMEFIGWLEHYLSKEAIKEFAEMQPGDVPSTWASTEALNALTGYSPQTDLKDGIHAFVEWYFRYYGSDGNT